MEDIYLHLDMDVLDHIRARARGNWEKIIREGQECQLQCLLLRTPAETRRKAIDTLVRSKVRAANCASQGSGLR